MVDLTVKCRPHQHRISGGTHMATIKDIAKKAGVAQGTVSNVLNGKGNVSSDKIRRVMEAARQLGYVPNERAAFAAQGNQ